MTEVDALKYIGKYCDLTLRDLVVEVEVKDAKISYGDLTLNVSPVNGRGSRWCVLKHKQLSNFRLPTPLD